MEWPGEEDRAENFIGCGWGEASFPTDCYAKLNLIEFATGRFCVSTAQSVRHLTSCGCEE